jgi:hypothetical protein
MITMTTLIGKVRAVMLVDNPLIKAEALGDLWGWKLKPEGACKDDRCVPLPKRDDDNVDVLDLASRLGMPVVHDDAHGLWAVGPEGGGRFLDSAVCPEIVLPDLDGNPFDLASLHGKKVLLVAWASW